MYKLFVLFFFLLQVYTMWANGAIFLGKTKKKWTGNLNFSEKNDMGMRQFMIMI